MARKAEWLPTEGLSNNDYTLLTKDASAVVWKNGSGSWVVNVGTTTQTEEEAKALAQRLEATAAMLRRGRPKMDKSELYEKLVFLCEQHDWSQKDSPECFRITDLVKEIGTSEAELLASAFEGRHACVTGLLRALHEVRSR